MNEYNGIITDYLHIDDYFDHYLTTNPYLFDYYKNQKCIEFDQVKSSQLDFYFSTFSYLEECFSCLLKQGLSHFKSIAILKEIQIFERHILQATQLEPILKLGKPVVGLSFNTQASSHSWDLFYTSAFRLMAKNGFLKEVDLATNTSKSYIPEEENSILKKKIRFKHVLEKFLLSYSKYNPFSKYRILVRASNPLLQDIAPLLSLRGFYFQNLNIARVNINTDLFDRDFEVGIFKNILLNRLNKYLSNEDLINYLSNTICQRLKIFSKVYNEQLLFTEQVATKHNLNSKDLIFFNYPGRLQDIVLAEFALNKGIKTVSFQHGHGREIMNENVKNNYTFHENCYTDFVFTYSLISQKITNDTPFKRKTSRTMVSGIPSSYLIHSSANNNVKTSYLFLSTLLLHGQQHNHHYPSSDWEQSKIELSIIKNVLSNLKHSVIYKQYPENRYPTPNVCLVEAKLHSNIKLLDSTVDFRYIKDPFNLIITSRATSTLGWAVFANKPLVFIDLPGFYKLKDDLVDHFSDSFFYFSVSDKEFTSKLLTFLSQDFESINKQWQHKAQSRELFKERYLGQPVNSKAVVEEIIRLKNS